MESSYKIDSSEVINAYDREAEASNWFGPEVVFGLSYKYMKSGDKIIDVGIGTGLSSILFHKAGLQIFGLDISSDMLEVTQNKISDAQLKEHNLLHVPYPYEPKSLNHAVCIGVMNFIKELDVIFKEVSRIISPSGIFGFVVADLKDGEKSEILVGSEHSHSDESIIMYRHSEMQIHELSKKNGFTIHRVLEFPVFMDSDKLESFKAKAYVIGKL